MGHILAQEQRNGVQAEVGLYIPLATARRDLSFVSYMGLQGEANRKKLAEEFKTPTTWKDYCSLHDSHCIVGDNVADHAPKTKEEENSYFVAGLYKGNFHIDNSNNCTLTDDCKGHIVAPRCDWTNYIEAQMYWNNISLVSKGSLPPNQGYSYNEMVQIYNAANATSSAVFIWWWSPEPLFETYENTDFALYKVTLPEPTRECVNYRRNGNIQRCGKTFEDRIGSDPTGSCDYEQESPTKALSNGFLTATEAQDDAIQSPAYELIKNIGLPSFAMESMLQDFNALLKTEGLSDPGRESVCKWINEHIDYLVDYVPKGYPRTLKSVEYEGFTSAGFILGIITLIAVIMSFLLIIKWRTTKVMKYSQVDTLLMTTLGVSLHSFIM